MWLTPSPRVNIRLHTNGRRHLSSASSSFSVQWKAGQGGPEFHQQSSCKISVEMIKRGAEFRPSSGSRWKNSNAQLGSSETVDKHSTDWRSRWRLSCCPVPPHQCSHFIQQKQQKRNWEFLLSLLLFFLFFLLLLLLLLLLRRRWRWRRGLLSRANNPTTVINFLWRMNKSKWANIDLRSRYSLPTQQPQFKREKESERHPTNKKKKEKKKKKKKKIWFCLKCSQFDGRDKPRPPLFIHFSFLLPPFLRLASFLPFSSL